jgi:hypothetical protein
MRSVIVAEGGFSITWPGVLPRGFVAQLGDGWIGVGLAIAHRDQSSSWAGARGEREAGITRGDRVAGCGLMGLTGEA